MFMCLGLSSHMSAYSTHTPECELRPKRAPEGEGEGGEGGDVMKGGRGQEVVVESDKR